MRGRRRGVTLVEMAVTGAIAIVVLGGMTAMHIRSARQEAALHDRIDLFAQGRRAFTDLGNEIRMGTRILQPALGGTAPLVVFMNRENRLIGYYLEADPSSSDGTTGRLMRIDYGEDDADNRVRPMASDLREARFTRTGTHELSIRLMFAASDTDRLPLATSLAIRNHVDPIDVGPRMTAQVD